MAYHPGMDLVDIPNNDVRIVRYTNFGAFCVGALLVLLELKWSPVTMSGVALMVATFAAELVFRWLDSRPVPPSDKRAKGFPVQPKDPE